jgi:hypothetical protein
MLSLAVAIVSAAVVLGTVLALLHLRGIARPPWTIGAIHGVLGAIGLTTLVLGLRGPPRGVQAGVASFGLASAVLAVIALTMGLGILVIARQTGRGIGVAIGVHGTVAVAAYVLLIAYVSLG